MKNTKIRDLIIQALETTQKVLLIFFFAIATAEVLYTLYRLLQVFFAPTSGASNMAELYETQRRHLQEITLIFTLLIALAILSRAAKTVKEHLKQKAQE
jgi:hypothetical protein